MPGKIIRASKLSSVLLLLLFLSCKKDKKTTDPTPIPPPAESTVPITIEFENLVGTEKLAFGKNYFSPKGDSFSVSIFNYFISNIVLVKSDNSIYSEPNSYHLLKHSSPSTSLITLPSVPAGSYKAIRFMLGVDSTANASGAKTGDLDQSIAGSMYWTWSSGYIFMKFEGSSPKSGDAGRFLSYHIGGYGGVNKAQRNFDLSLGGSVVNFTSGSPAIRLSVDVNELFKNPVTIDFFTMHTYLSVGPNAKLMADNYADMIRLKEIRF